MRDINQSSPVHTPTGDQTGNVGTCPGQEIESITVLMYRIMLPSTEPPGQGNNLDFYHLTCYIIIRVY